MGKNEVALKDYFENKLASREQDNGSLRKQLAEKESDLKHVIVKYNHLERKLKELLEAQNKLSDFENRIISLGLDQNLIKNMAQLFSRQQQ
jgi:predicted nucleotidyltransferase